MKEIPFPTDNYIAPLNINYASISSNSIRITNVHTINVNLPPIMLQKGKKIIVDLINNLNPIIDNPICSIIRASDTQNFNFASNCNFIDDQKVEIKIGTTDYNNTEAYNE